MLTSQTRWLLLQAGRRSIDIWLRAGHMSRPGLGSDARVAYDRLADKATWPEQQSLRPHLALWVLPAAAIYTTLKEDGLATEEAVDVVTRATTAFAGVKRVTYWTLLSSGPGRRLFIRFFEPAVRPFFPSPGWEWTSVERSSQRVALDITRCYWLDTLRQLDAAPAIAAFCAVDKLVFTDMCPQLRFSRSGTLGTGATRCDFCVELVQPERTPAASIPR